MCTAQEKETKREARKKYGRGRPFVNTCFASYAMSGAAKDGPSCRIPPPACHCF
jgi:hypothetical protein